MGVDDDLLAGLGIAHRHQADVGQVHLERIDRRTAVTSWRVRELAERRVPARRADEVGDDEDAAAALDDALAGPQQVAQVRSRPAALAAGRGRHALQQVQHVQAAAARRQHGVDLGAVEQGADAVAVPREQPRQHADELARDLALGEPVEPKSTLALRSTRNQARELAVLGELAHVGLLQARGDVPVDVAHVVVVLVLAQVGQVEAGAAKSVR